MKMIREQSPYDTVDLSDLERESLQRQLADVCRRMENLAHQGKVVSERMWHEKRSIIAKLNPWNTAKYSDDMSSVDKIKK